MAAALFAESDRWSHRWIPLGHLPRGIANLSAGIGSLDSNCHYLPLAWYLVLPPDREDLCRCHLKLRNADFGLRCERESMLKKELEARTKRFALPIIQLVGKLSRGKVSDVIGYQLLKSGTSI